MALTSGEGLIGVVIGGVVGVAGTIVAAWTQRGQRAHDREMASAARRHEGIASVYPDLMRFVVTEVERLRRTLPIFGPVPDPPKPFDEPSALDLQARVYAYASEPVKSTMEEFLRQIQGFYVEAAYVSDMEQRRDGGYLGEGESPIHGRVKAEEKRAAALSASEDLRILVRDELAK